METHVLCSVYQLFCRMAFHTDGAGQIVRKRWKDQCWRAYYCRKLSLLSSCVGFLLRNPLPISRSKKGHQF